LPDLPPYQAFTKSNAVTLQTNALIYFLSGSGRISAIGPYTGPGDGGVTIYSTNASSGNALTSFVDVNTNGLSLNQGVFGGDGSGLFNLSGGSLPSWVRMTNGFVLSSNAYPIVAMGGWKALGNVGCCWWMSNNVLYRLCTNALSGNASTNLDLVLP
jgi:hypothetical protein